jgi:uncharacterized protein (DUF1501 family)
MSKNNHSTTFNRRNFLKTAGAATAVAGLAPRLSFAVDEYSDNILVFVFQRGGSDGLSFLAPMDGHPDRGHYNSWRVNGTRIASGDLLSVGGGWGLNPAAAPLLDLWSDKSLAIVQAAGLPWSNQSHFEAERYAELGTPGNRFTKSGWLTRHLQSANNLPPSMVLPAVVTESTIRYSLLAEPSAVTMRYPTNFDFDSAYYEEEQETALADIYGFDSDELDVSGSQALAAQSIVEAIDWAGYTPSHGASYPVRPDDPGRLTSFGEEMKIIAQLIKENVGLKCAVTDIGGWDTHTEQGNGPGGGFYNNVKDLSEALLAFLTDLDVKSPNGKTWAERTTVLVYSEFGRRAYDNADAGTDHGWGNNILALGGGVNGGQLYGDWPGLDEESLLSGRHVYVTTDFRTVFSECLLKRFRNNKIHQVFPGFTEEQYKPLGVFSGSLVAPDFADPEIIFRSSLE